MGVAYNHIISAVRTISENIQYLHIQNTIWDWEMHCSGLIMLEKKRLVWLEAVEDCYEKSKVIEHLQETNIKQEPSNL